MAFTSVQDVAAARRVERADRASPCPSTMTPKSLE
jgi:hypothetical protein